MAADDPLAQAVARAADERRFGPQLHCCPWCQADITGTTPDRPHVCGFVRAANA